MKTEEKLKIILGLEIIVLSAIILGVLSFNSDRTSLYRLYELLGTVIAGIITTFGIYKMRELT